MPSINPGPAITSTASLLAVLAPQTSVNANSQGQGTNALRLLAVGRGLSLSGTGDTALLPIINSSSWSVANIVITNSQISGAGGSIATAAVGLFTAAAAGGTALKANAALASNTSQTVVFQATVATTALQSVQAIYVNVGTALAGATADFFVYGYDLT